MTHKITTFTYHLQTAAGGKSLHGNQGSTANKYPAPDESPQRVLHTSRAELVTSPAIKDGKVLNNGEITKMNENGITVLSLFDGKYAACSDGTIISYARKNHKKLIGKIGSAGYRMVVLTIDNKKQYHNVHRIIAKAFIPNPKGLREVNHKDGNKLNNAVSNLEWVSTRENQIHARNNGLEGSSKISMEIAEMIRKDNGSNRELAKKYGLKKTEIGLIRQNKRWVA